MAGAVLETPQDPLKDAVPARGSPAGSLFSAREWQPGTSERSDTKTFGAAIEKAIEEILTTYGSVGTYLRNRYVTPQNKQEFVNKLCQFFPMSPAVEYNTYNDLPAVSLEASHKHGQTSTACRVIASEVCTANGRTQPMWRPFPRWSQWSCTLPCFRSRRLVP